MRLPYLKAAGIFACPSWKELRSVSVQIPTSLRILCNISDSSNLCSNVHSGRALGANACLPTAFPLTKASLFLLQSALLNWGSSRSQFSTSAGSVQKRRWNQTECTTPWPGLVYPKLDTSCPNLFPRFVSPNVIAEELPCSGVRYETRALFHMKPTAESVQREKMKPLLGETEMRKRESGPASSEPPLLDASEAQWEVCPSHSLSGQSSLCSHEFRYSWYFSNNFLFSPG